MKTKNWLRISLMLEDTELNRSKALSVYSDIQRIVDHLEGKKIIKAEQLFIFGMAITKKAKKK